MVAAVRPCSLVPGITTTPNTVWWPGAGNGRGPAGVHGADLLAIADNDFSGAARRRSGCCGWCWRSTWAMRPCAAGAVQGTRRRDAPGDGPAAEGQ